MLLARKNVDIQKLGYEEPQNGFEALCGIVWAWKGSSFNPELVPAERTDGVL